MKKTILFTLLTATVVALSGCVTPKIALEYRTETTAELDGRVFVGKFQYLPATGVAREQIPNTALGGGVILTEPVADFFANAVRREFRQAGISLKQGGCQLNGEIQKVLIDDLGFTVDYDLDVRYILEDRNDTVLLDKSYVVALDDMTKMVVVEIVFSNLNRMFANNIKQFMQDDLFVRSLDQSCQAYTEQKS